MNGIKQDPNGFYYYDVLPAGATRISIQDFKNKYAKFKPGTPYCVKSFHTGLYNCFRVQHTVSDALKPFVEAGRVYFLHETKNS